MPGTPVTNPVRPAPKRRRAASGSRPVDSVVIYCRVSTEEQERSGAGLAAQEAECRAYAARHQWQVVAVIHEEAVSGKVHPTKRPGYVEALAMLTGCSAGVLLVRRTDRVSRRLRHFLDVVDAADAAGWTVCTTDGKVDTGTAAGRFQVNVMASAHEYERDVIAERTREALAAKRAAGVRLGRPSAIPDDILARIVNERAGGASLNAIARGLNADSIPNPTASAAGWHAPTVSRALETARLNSEALAALAS